MLDRHNIVYRWDLDKTYLRTEFDTLRDLLRTAVEPATRKQTMPGAASLIREIQSTRPAGLYILSGSPEHMRRVLETKLRLDGVQWDALTLKPSLRNILRGRFHLVRDQVGYKLAALLESRAAVAVENVEIMFGDDAEADAYVYSLYADICSGQVSMDTLAEVLQICRVPRENEEEVLAKARAVQARPHVVAKIFIHLERLSAPSAFLNFGSRLCPFYNYFQPAVVLAELGAMDYNAALRVGADLVIQQTFSADALLASFFDLVHRGRVSKSAAEGLIDAIQKSGKQAYSTAYKEIREFAKLLEQRASMIPESIDEEPASLDHLAIYIQDLDRVKKARLRVIARRLIRAGT